MDLGKSQRGPPLSFLALRDFFRKKSLKGPPSIFDVLQQRMLKNPKGSPFSAPGVRYQAPGAPIRFNFWVFRVL